MTDNDKMEELSKKYIEVLANYKGYFNQEGRDYGTDLTIRKATRSIARNRLFTSGRGIDIQLKAAYKRNLKYNPTYVTFDLEVKNYNDLVERRQENGDLFPLYLIVFVVPNRIDEWILFKPDELLIRECAYYYEIDSAATISQNSSTKSIHIPLTNVVDLNLFDNLFSKHS